MEIAFSMSGWTTQQIELDPDCEFSQQEVFAMLEEGKVLTSLQANGELLYVADGSLRTLGYVVDNDPEAEYFDFELKDAWEDDA